MKHRMLFLAMMFLLPVAMVGAGDDDSFLNDEDAIVESGVNFDIPPEASEWRDEFGYNGAEKKSCTCSTEGDEGWCAHNPMYYLIKVQNWGINIAKHVVVIDDIVDYLDYVPGTTEMATQFDENGNGTDWAVISDGPEDAFPLSGDGCKVAETMTPCDRELMSCSDTRLIRFKVMPKSGIPYNVTFTNQAAIRSADNPKEFLTNKHKSHNWGTEDCWPPAVCLEPSKSECGGGESDVDTMPDVDESVVDKAETEADFIMPKDDGCGCSVVW